jgi:hypothetical protein
MPNQEKAHQSGGSIPDTVLADGTESKSSTEFAQALARSVFGRSYIVVREPIGSRFRTRASSRIRSWRAPR